MGVIWLALMVPPVYEAVLRADLWLAYRCNGVIGHNDMFDLTLGLLNSRLGDVLVVVAFLSFFVRHAMRPAERRERLARQAFWTWVVLAFILIYQAQRLLEDVVDRNSPSMVLEDWHNLRHLYEFNAKVYNTHSYPSGHATAYYFFAFMALTRFRRVGWVLLVIALVVPTTRICTGAHWPSDIFLGSLPIAWLLAALMTQTPLRRFEGRIARWLEAVQSDRFRIFGARLGSRLRAAWDAFRSAPEGESKRRP